MWFVSKQSFLEEPDGIQTVFTTAQNYSPGTLWIFQGSLVMHPSSFVEIPPNKVCFIIPALTQAVTVDPVADNTFVCAGHGLAINDIRIFGGDTLPEGVVRDSVYYILPVDVDTFQVSLVESGPAVQFVRPVEDGGVFIAEPGAPLSESGELWYNAFIAGSGASGVLADGLWELQDFLLIFNIQPTTFGYAADATEAFEFRISYALHSASVLVKAYLRSRDCLAFYDDAKSDTPENLERTEILRYAEMLLIFKNLLEEPGDIGKGAVSEHIEKFTDAIQITKRYATYGANKYTTIIKKDTMDILELLIGPFCDQYNVTTAIESTTTIYAMSHALLEPAIKPAEIVLGRRF